MHVIWGGGWLLTYPGGCRPSHHSCPTWQKRLIPRWLAPPQKKILEKNPKKNIQWLDRGNILGHWLFGVMFLLPLLFNLFLISALKTRRRRKRGGKRRREREAGIRKSASCVASAQSSRPTPPPHISASWPSR